MSSSEMREYLKKLAIELLVYGVLVIAYFFLVLRFLGEPLFALSKQHLLGYALLSLMLVFLQTAGMDYLTTWISGRLHVVSPEGDPEVQE
ncbi:MAG: hypothetical protein GXP41_08715 [Chloroflexi bacterium]|nr:hypothetical protein [Chloroflexota bacterium]